MLRWIGLVLAFASLAMGQSWTLFGYVQAPANASFTPTTEDLVCAALEAPDQRGLSLRVIPGACAYPVVRWPYDTDDNRQRYALTFQLAFWGQGKASDPVTGVGALTTLLKNSYLLSLAVSGAGTGRRLEYLPPLQPGGSVNGPAADGPGWTAYTAPETDIPFGDPTVLYTLDLSDFVCQIFGAPYAPCWYGVLEWDLPTRLRLAQDAPGNPQVQIAFQGFRRR